MTAVGKQPTFAIDVGIFPTHKRDMHIAKPSPAGDPLAMQLRHIDVATPVEPEALNMRQLRHHVGNTWQRLLCEVAIATEAAESEETRRIARQIDRRIRAAVSVADLLFGFTEAPGPFADRLERLCRHSLSAQANAVQQISLDIQVKRECPLEIAMPVLRVAQEMVANAVKHGMHDRIRGRIRVEFTERASLGLLLRVSDDGWGLGRSPMQGEGTMLMRALANEIGGTVGLKRDLGLTVASLVIPRFAG